MVIPACPPMTVTATSLGSLPMAAPTKVFARQTSNVVTPHSLVGSYTPCFFKTSAAIGTVLLTGLEIMARTASGQYLAQASIKFLTMPDKTQVEKREKLFAPAARCRNLFVPFSIPFYSASHVHVPALVLKRSSRVIPGFRGTPAGMTTTEAPLRAASMPVSCEGGHDPAAGRWPVTVDAEGI